VSKRAEFRAIHKIADRMEVRLARALRLSSKRMAARIPLDALADAVADKDARAVGALLSQLNLEDALKPSGEILRDAYLKGGQEAAKDIRELTSGD
jgi:hypothetical protein